MRTLVWIFSSALLMLGALPVKAEISQGLPFEIKSTRVLIEGKQRQSYWTVKNRGKHSYVYTIGTYDTDEALHEGGRSRDFLVTPPTGLLKPNEERTFRIVRVGDYLPNTRESMALLRLKLLPSGQNPQEPHHARIQSLMSIYVKLFYRPESLVDGLAVEKATQSLKASCHRGDFTIENSSSYWLTLDSVRVNRTNLISDQEKAPVIAPYARWSRMISKCPPQVEVSTVKENGLPTAFQLLQVEEMK